MIFFVERCNILQFGGQKYHDVEFSRVFCKVLDGIECYGERTFLTTKEYPCLKLVDFCACFCF